MWSSGEELQGFHDLKAVLRDVGLNWYRDANFPRDFRSASVQEMANRGVMTNVVRTGCFLVITGIILSLVLLSAAIKASLYLVSTGGFVVDLPA